MSAAPELPDTDDPFEFFALPPDASERDLRRAYTRLLRIYKPERHPAEFQRVRAMYERGCTWIDLGTRWEEAPESSVYEEPQRVTEEHADAWQRVAEGRVDEALALWRRDRDENPDDPASYVQAFLALEAGGASFKRAAEELVAGLRAQAPVTPWVTTLLDAEEVAAIVAHDDVPWDRLGHADAGLHAAQLFRERVHHLLRNGHGGEAFDLLSRPRVRDAVLSGTAARLCALEAVCHGLWTGDPRAITFYTELVAELDPNAAGMEHSQLEECVELEWCSRAWRVREEAASIPQPLAQFLAGCAVEDLATDAAARRLWRDLLHAPETYLRTLLAMSVHAPDALRYLRIQLGVDDADPDAEDVDEDARDAPAPLTQPQADAVADFARQVDAVVDASILSNVQGYVVLACLAAVVAGFVWTPWWSGVIGLIVWPIAGMIWMIWSDRILYRKFVRSPLAALVIDAGVRPRQVVAYVKAHRSGLEELPRLDGEMRGDKAVEALAELGLYARAAGTAERATDAP